ncbi:hypothetical protein AZI86_01105 [Bdellovibrio bacteriovorus]|uniref:Beta-cyclase n=1 Tax=Bdellovibrio bacteriovorus TaxID=959 RepID=A0A150WMV7_BDEBC|nr:lycopene cyclase domain-containing protein [Bdellovibrio bacteriovorus]KYG65704.1 hypothetical protein AZI86_01105 [Bdellovibrio bacteriovorus]
MTYAQFLLIFIVPLTVLGMVYFYRSSYPQKKTLKEAIYLLIFLAVTYTTPWDNYLVMTGVWNYEDHNILFRIGYVPFEEYCFFILQTIMTSCWVLWILKHTQIRKASAAGLSKHLGTLLLLGLLAASIMMLQSEKTRYLGLILVWVTPVFLLQWVSGGEHLLANLKTYALCLFPPTFYLWIVDNYAIYRNIWAISETQTIGLKVSYLPFEEAVFFLATNIMLCQGLLLYLLLKDDFLLKLKKRHT